MFWSHSSPLHTLGLLSPTRSVHAYQPFKAYQINTPLGFLSFSFSAPVCILSSFIIPASSRCKSLLLTCFLCLASLKIFPQPPSQISSHSAVVMGLVFGKITVETPKYTVLADGQDYEVRDYGANLVAEVTYDPSETKGGKNGGFMVLANYIGALGKANNVKADGSGESEGEKIAMTAPVMTQETGKAGESEKIAMTAPVITQESTEGEKKMMMMQFVLPSKYNMGNVPRPTDPRVVVKEVPARKYGVLKFNGVADDKLVKQKVETLRKGLQAADYKIVGEHVLAQFNPPWTIPHLRTNEVMLPVE